MHALDLEIEHHDRLIAECSEYIDYYRTGDTWLEWRDQVSQAHSRLVCAQAVLFAIKEGL